MTCGSGSKFDLKRGASFDLTVRIPSRFADGHFAGWTLESQVRDTKGGLIATLAATWVDPALARFIRLVALDTRAWPLGEAQFDIVLQAPDGFRWPTSTVTFTVVRGATSV